MTKSKQESLDGQEQQRTSTTCQETVTQASSAAGYAGRSQAAQAASTAATVRAGWIGAGSRLQEGDEEAKEKEKAVRLTGTKKKAESPGGGGRRLQRFIDQEEIGQQSPEVDRSVQVVDQL